MRQADRTEREADDQHQVGEAGDAFVLRLELRDALFQIVDAAGVGAAARIDRRRARGEEDQHRHPHITDADIDHRELAEGGGIDVEHFAHRQHVGAAADPAAGQCGHAGPGIAGHRGRMQPAHQLERDHRTEHDAEGRA
jgi:hypothetical protein